MVWLLTTRNLEQSVNRHQPAESVPIRPKPSSYGNLAATEYPMKLSIKKTHPDAILPTRQKPGDSGLDLHALLPDGSAYLKPGERLGVRTGIAIELPEDHEAQIRPRSGLTVKRGVLAATGTIDNGYRGELLVTLFNLSYDGYTVSDGDRIAQLVVSPVVYPEVIEVDELSETERDVGGFGSTGV